MTKQMPKSWRDKWEAQFKENTIVLCIFLKLLWETTKDSPQKLSMHNLMIGLKIPHGDELLPILQQKGIIRKAYINNSYKGVVTCACTYQWISKTEPNIEMAKALLRLVHVKRIADKHKQLWPLDFKRVGTLY